MPDLWSIADMRHFIDTVHNPFMAQINAELRELDRTEQEQAALGESNLEFDTGILAKPNS